MVRNTRDWGAVRIPGGNHNRVDMERTKEMKSEKRKCPRCNSPKLMYHLGKEGVSVECTYCGLRGPARMTSWSADEAWDKMRKEKKS